MKYKILYNPIVAMESRANPPPLESPPLPPKRGDHSSPFAEK